MGCSNKNEMHLGIWKNLPTKLSLDQGESVFLEMTSSNDFFVRKELNSNENEIPVPSLKYEIDYSKEPIWLDLINLDKEPKKEASRVLCIVRFSSENRMEVRFGTENVRFNVFDSTDLNKNLFFEKISTNKELTKNIPIKKVKELKKFPYYKTDLEEMKLRGNVKSLREFSYKPIDDFGKITKGERLFEDGFDYYHFEVPKGGFLKFNKKGSFEEVINYDKTDIIKNKNIFSYNEKGLKKEENKYDSNDIFNSKVVFKYNEKGFLIDKSWYDEKGKLESKLVFDNNIENNKISEKLYFSKGELHTFTNYKYDSDGNLTSSNKRYYNSSMISTNSYFTYDEKGNLISKISTNTIEEGSVDSGYNYSYNENEDKTEYWFDSSSDSKTTYEYKYDSNNNWVKRIQFDSGFPKFIIEREIKYFQQ